MTGSTLAVESGWAMGGVSGRRLLIAAMFSIVTTLVAVALSAATGYFRKD